MSDQTISQVFQKTVERFGSRPALGCKRGDEYEYLTYAELNERVRALARGLADLGVKKGDRIAILSENRPEWAITDLAAQTLGVVTVPIYPTLPASQVKYLVSDSAARVLVVSDKKQIAKAAEVKPEVRTLDHVVAMDAPCPDGMLAFEDVVDSGRKAAFTVAQLDEQAASVLPADIATLIYTSGTTGNPKGAMLTHRNLLHTPLAVHEVVRLDENDLFLSFAPLSHIIERTGGHYLPLSIGACIVYSQGLFAIAGEFATVRPTIFLCVPRLYENMQERIMEQAAKAPPNKKKMFDWAMAVGTEAAKRRLAGRGAGPILAIQQMIADRLVLSKIREKATGGRMRFLVAGGAPLNPATAVFFDAIGVPLLEGYGLTECPVISLNRPEKRKPGTVGPLLPGLEVKIADDGEVLSRGPSLMRGYFGKPEATAEAIDPEGWFHTGDIGELTPDGFLRITDRKKDIIVLANGKKVAPQPIEADLKESPYISEIVLMGDNANGVVAIVVPAFDHLRTWAKQNELPARDLAELTKRAETQKLLKEEIDQRSKGLAEFERIKRFKVVTEPFSIEGGELTPTLKVKRKVIAQKYAELIEQMVK